MGRRKQSRPNRSGGIIGNLSAPDNTDAGRKTENIERSEPIDDSGRKEVYSGKPFFVEINSTQWDVDRHLDIAEVLLTNIRFANGFSDYKLLEDCYRESKISLRLKMHTLEEQSFRLGHWPVISADNIFLEFIVLRAHDMEDTETLDVMFSGNFDGTDEGVSGLVHLVSQKLLMLRPVSGFWVSESFPSFRLRVEILEAAFDACESLSENTRQPWKKSMINVMAWLRPEVTAQEAKYGISKPKIEEVNKYSETVVFGSGKHVRFDAAGFYEAIKPSKGEPMLEDEIPDLLPQLRPYQRRAACWMVQREKGTFKAPVYRRQNQFINPICVPVDFLDMHSQMFYNPFSGNVSLQPESSLSYVSGGILADEMGLGKTVELLACIFVHRKLSRDNVVLTDDEGRDIGRPGTNMKRLKRERVECVCGALTESPKYKGLWVQCDVCDAWQHADCVGYSPRGRSSEFKRASRRKGCKMVQDVKPHNRLKKRSATSLVVMDGNYICSSCSELIQATDSTITSGATLIVCPAPILPQWHAEIIRHTKPGSIKICVYEGIRNLNPSTTSRMDMDELAGADIVLTTYDILKDDLSHDSDRHDGDRRIMRFQKRYPVVPTLLTRIFWWRICLDEAQMVESNTAAATEMALRLRAHHRWCITGTPIQRRLDDLFGLLRFLGASPFDVRRWWVDIIRDPYERRYMGAMEFTHKFFKQIMWRSSKVLVSDELQLPPQEECISWLTFSPIEAHFYHRQHESCVTRAREVIKSIKDDINKRNSLSGFDALHEPFLAHGEAAKLLHSLLKLRQACCHPQVGSSGLRSLQQTPMTMDEILEVLVGKAKIEGEEALRRLVVALNGLAGIAAIEQDLPRAVSLYREALALAEENCNDFRLDPLLNLHIHHNLAELLPTASEHSQQSPSMGELASQNPTQMKSEMFECGESDQHLAKRQKISKDSYSVVSFDDIHLENGEQSCNFTSDISTAVNIRSKDVTYDLSKALFKSFSKGCLREACKNIEQRYLSVFISKLSLAQQEFSNSYVQICEAFSKYQGEQAIWWLHALDLIKQDKDSSNELIRKIDEAVSGAVNNSKTRISSRFQSISGLKYLIQTGLDSLEASRKALLEKLLEIDQTMEKPRDEDVERVRYCPNCQPNCDGPLCVHCEVDELFQAYEARLFRLKKGDNGGIVTSAEEAVDLQKRKFALNRFFGALSNLRSSTSSVGNEANKQQRDVGANVVVSRSPSELEVTLGVIKSYSRTLLGREAMSFATKQLLLFEAMRKEYAQARSLSIAQAQILRAHDEIKMATSRLRLRESENDASAIDALCSEELIVASVDFTNEKFLALSSLSRIKGQLRYLKGLVKQKTQLDGPNVSSVHLDTSNLGASFPDTTVECPGNVDEEPCPICHEKLTKQKMVFQCGHVTCCKCFVEMTEQLTVSYGKSQGKWVHCPTCRQRTDFGNIAFVDDRQNKSGDHDIPIKFQDHDKSEICLQVKGSYGTKIEAITRRILWIKSTEPEAKVLVFSSWNDVLDVLEHALEVNSIAYVRMKGGRKSNAAITQFKGHRCGKERKGKIQEQQPDQKPIQVLLLLIQHGANGLNILEAQHVVLVEPLLNPAAEAQAVNRVHRIGQEKTTFVHRFIVKDTVEESIYKLNRSKTANPTISGNTKNQDQLVLTLNDVESLFSPKTSAGPPYSGNNLVGSLRHLPPAVAAGLAAEKRLQEQII